MKKTFFTLFIIFGILVFLTTTNFKLSGSDEGGYQWSVVPADTFKPLKSHDVFNDYNPNLVIPPYMYYPPTKDNPLIFTNVDISNNAPAPQNEPSVKISRKNPLIVVSAWRDFRINYNPAYRRVGYSRSTDGGVTWATSTLLDSLLLGSGLLRNSDPCVATDTAGNFYISTIALDNSNGNSTLAIYKSTNGGNTFTTGQILAQGSSEDKEMMTTDLTPGSPFRNYIYISWSRLSLATDIRLIRSSNAGATWSSPVVVSSSGTSPGQGSDPAVGANGELYVVWVNANTYGTQYFAKSTDGGLTFGTPVAIATGTPASIPWSQGGPTTFPSIACDVSGGARNGYIYVTWCDGRNGDADIFLTRSTDHGSTWSSALRVNNDGLGNGKVQAWPWIAVNESGNIAINFFDTRNTPNNNTIEAWVARSSDGGLTFTNDVLSSQQSPTNIPNSDVRYGDYIGIDSWGGHTVPVWTDERAGGYDMDIYTAVVTNVTPSHDIAVGPFLSLPSQFFVNTAYAIKTKVQNVGTSNETAVPIRFYVNGTLTNTTNVNLNANQVDSVNNNWTPVAVGVYTLKYISALATDSNHINDTVQTTITVLTSQPALCEAFNSTTFPPSGWSVIFTGTNYWFRQTFSGFGLGVGCADFDNYDASNGTTQSLITTTFPATTGPFQGIQFDIAYCPWSSFPYDSLIILTSTDGGTTYTTLTRLGEQQMGTVTTCTHPFAPSSNNWGTRFYYVPVGTNKISFTAVSGFGDHLYLDSTCIVAMDAITNNGNQIPTVYSLSQNYPNPFNPETKIQFGLPKAGQVKLVVYDLLGAEIATLVNENMQAGYHNLTFNGVNMASGVYFYRITAGDFINVKKMVLVK